MIHAVIPDCRWAPLGDKCPQTIHHPTVDGALSIENPTISPSRELCFFFHIIVKVIIQSLGSLMFRRQNILLNASSCM